jgi:hypothetical protein
VKRDFDSFLHKEIPMNEKSSFNRKRRKVLGGIAALAGVPLMNTILSAQALAADLPHLKEDDPTAQALHYHQAATAAPRTDKPGAPAKDQFCHNCMFVKATSGTWRPCQIFPGKAVNANGWCASWTKKAG